MRDLLKMFKAAVRRSSAFAFPSFDPGAYRLRFADKSDSEIFSEIYRKKIWGGRLSRGAYSGSGSRDKAIVTPYVTALRAFLLQIGRPSILDLGCGDFHVGHQLIDCTRSFAACDIVDFVIEQNQRRYPNVKFFVVDAARDELPAGDVVLIRQVFQHLGNAQIMKVLPKLAAFKYAIVTEHVPGFEGFVPNLDKRSGPDHRVSIGSGIELTQAPFNLTAASIRVLCEVSEFGGIIRTTAYERPVI